MNDDEDIDFAAAMSGVKRLRQDRVAPEASRKSARIPPARTIVERQSTVDANAPAAFAEQEYFTAGLQVKLRKRIRQGLPRPEARLDLHGLRQNEALDQLETFLDAAIEDGLRMLLVIHGQGWRSADAAILKPLVRRWLAGHPAVLACCPAQPRDGAGGASYVFLRLN